MSYPTEAYENYMVPPLFGAWASHLIKVANPQSGECVLDVACGTGIVARSIAPYVGITGKITGLELNSDMLAVAQSTAEREGYSIEWRQGRAEKLPFPDRSFDLVVCQFALMFFADQRLALTEMRRVLTSDGRVVLSVWQGLDRHPFYQALHQVSLQRLGRSVVEQVFSLGHADELRCLLMDSGFQHIEIKPMSLTARFANPDEFLAWEMDVDPMTVPAMQNLNNQAQQGLMDSIRDEMQAVLHEVTEADHVVMPFHAFMVYAQ